MKIRNLQSLLVCPIILWELLADGPDWHLRSWSCFCLSLFSTVDEWSGSSLDEFHWSILEDKVLTMTHLDLQKTFPDIPCVSQMLGGPSLRLGTPIERLSIPSGIGWGRNDTGNVWISTAYWFSILKILWSFIQLISFCNSCIRPESSNVVFWCSTNVRLAIVSNVELWNSLTLPFQWDFFDELHVIPNFAARTVLEEVVDLVVELLRLELLEIRVD